MRNPYSIIRAACWLVVLAVLAPGTVVAAPGSSTDIDAAKVQQHLDFLTGLPHRLAGSDEGRRAGDYIIAQLRQAGFENLIIQRFPVVQLHQSAGDCYFEAGGQRVPMQPLRPNGVALPVTPEAGIAGKTVYLHDGDWQHFRGVNVDGRIAVLDYRCGGRWLHAISRGAKAVVLVGPTTDEGPGELWSEAIAELPRFYVDRDVAEAHGLLNGSEITLHSRMTYRQTEGRNIFALIPGTAQPSEGEHDTVAMACEYDTFGPMPFNTPMTRNAANVAGLIEAARHLRAKPGPRATLIAFFDNNAQSQAGQYQFYFARSTHQGDDPSIMNSLAWMRKQRDFEREFVAGRLKALRDLMTVVQTSPADRPVGVDRRTVDLNLEHIYNEIKNDLYVMKVDIQRLKKDIVKLKTELPDATDESYARLLDERIDSLTRQLAVMEPASKDRIARLEAHRSEVAKLRRGFEQSSLIPAESRSLFLSMAADRVVELEARMAEIDSEQAMYDNYMDVARQLDMNRVVAMVFLDIAPVAEPWTVCIPSSMASPSYRLQVGRSTWSGGTGGIAWVANPMATRRLSDMLESPAAKSRWPGLAGAPRDVFDDSPEMSDVSGEMTYLLKFGSLGTMWRNVGLDSEKAADAAAYASHLSEAVELFDTLATTEELGRSRILKRASTLYWILPEWVASQERYRACVANRYGGSSVEAELPVGNALLRIGHQLRSAGDNAPHRVWGTFYMAAANGMFTTFTREGSTNIVGFRTNDRGQINMINQLRTSAAVAGGSAWNAPAQFYARKLLKIAMFKATGFSLVHPNPPFDSATSPRVLQGVNNVEFRRMNVTLDNELMAVWLETPRAFKVLSNSMLMLNSMPSDPAGSGYPPPAGAMEAYRHAADDIWVLNEDRLNKLRRHGIQQNSLELLHSRAEDHRQEAARLDESDPGAALSHHAAALGYSGAAYAPIRSVADDLIKAVVILLLMAIPFAFSVERLVVGTANVYRQIVGFALIFLTVFIILYLVHPAFRFASFPIVVLLAFVIMIMSGMVIFIMWTKFEYEIHQFQGIATASHRSSRNSRGTVAAAVSLGISTMRRRPLRTFLTALTIILLTFTILFFGAFNTERTVRGIFVGPGRPARQIELTPPGVPALSANQINHVKLLWAPHTQVYVRRWNVGAAGSHMVGRMPDHRLFTIDGWADLNPQDFHLYARLDDALQGDIDGFVREGGIFLPPHLFEPYKDQVGKAEISFLNRRWVLRGTFDPTLLARVRTVENASFIPPNVEEMRRLLELQNPQDTVAQDQKLKEMEISAFPLLDAGTIALISPIPGVQAGGRTLVLLPPNDEAAKRIGGELATLMNTAVTVNAGGQVQRMIYTQQLQMADSSKKGKSFLGGFAKLVVPLTLGGLIIFSTMLSSVSDREREIFTFSALGLAPTHVAVLFFAEAAVYSVIGGLGGYLFSQVFGKTVEQMAIWGWVVAPSMNYSSMNAMVAILVVMATVLVSTIYPAMKASRSANPGIQRRWKMPAPQGDAHNIDFPFTVSQFDLVGLISFLEEYFLSHHDRSVGSFAADDVTIERENGKFVLKASVWLQPFDQGVSQTFELRTRPSDIEGIDEVTLAMRRQSGPPVIWQRSNKVFINDIRQQFIFWRTIDEDMMDHYRDMTVRRFGLKLEEESSDA